MDIDTLLYVFIYRWEHGVGSIVFDYNRSHDGYDLLGMNGCYWYQYLLLTKMMYLGPSLSHQSAIIADD